MAHESSIRRKAFRRGFVIRKSRAWKNVPNLDNHGDYMLLDMFRNIPVLGYRFDAEAA